MLNERSHVSLISATPFMGVVPAPLHSVLPEKVLPEKTVAQRRGNHWGKPEWRGCGEKYAKTSSISIHFQFINHLQMAPRLIPFLPHPCPGFAIRASLHFKNVGGSCLVPGIRVASTVTEETSRLLHF
jgi:hypothetical protein